jgi:hypothetical protein
MYRHLSGYAHSSSLSILQIKQSLQKKEQSFLIRASIDTVGIIAANFIREYCDLFPMAKAILDADAKGSELVGTWVHIGRRVDKRQDPLV